MTAPRAGASKAPSSSTTRPPRVPGQPMLLAIDVGNSNVTLGLYDGEELAASWRLVTRAERTADEVGLELLQGCRRRPHRQRPCGLPAPTRAGDPYRPRNAG